MIAMSAGMKSCAVDFSSSSVEKTICL